MQVAADHLAGVELGQCLTIKGELDVVAAGGLGVGLVVDDDDGAIGFSKTEVDLTFYNQIVDGENDIEFVLCPDSRVGATGEIASAEDISEALSFFACLLRLLASQNRVHSIAQFNGRACWSLEICQAVEKVTAWAAGVSCQICRRR